MLRSHLELDFIPCKQTEERLLLLHVKFANILITSILIDSSNPKPWIVCGLHKDSRVCGR